MSNIDESISSTISTIHKVVPANLNHPQIGIVCGSGLSGLAENLREVVEVPYENLEGFATSTVVGHKSILAFGLMGAGDGIPVVAMLGRFHPYEGRALSEVVYPIRVMARLGIKTIIITNAAGSLNPDIPVGTIVVLRDHIALPNLTGPLNPLLGPPTPNRARFLPLSNAYSPSLRRLAFLAAHQLNLGSSATAEGTYAWVSGPTYETSAEGKFLRNAGGDVVGMSTIPEVVAAREEDVEVLVLSLVTNKVILTGDATRSIKEEVEAELAGKPVKVEQSQVVSHEEVLAMGQAKSELMKQLVRRIVELVPTLSV